MRCAGAVRAGFVLPCWHATLFGARWLWERTVVLVSGSANQYHDNGGYNSLIDSWSVAGDMACVFETERMLLENDGSLKQLEGMWMLCKVRKIKFMANHTEISLATVDAIMNAHACVQYAGNRFFKKETTIIGQRPRILLLNSYSLYIGKIFSIRPGTLVCTTSYFIFSTT